VLVAALAIELVQQRGAGSQVRPHGVGSIKPA
jgi:hypothetical protein